jgi:hypothetical protein
MAMTFVEIIQRYMKLKSAWTHVIEHYEKVVDDDSFNSADIVVLGLVAHFSKSPIVYIQDLQLSNLIMLAVKESGLEDIFDVANKASIIERTPPNYISLISKETIDEGYIEYAGDSQKQIILVHGWRKPWTPSNFHSADCLDGKVFVQISSVSPALWRTGLNILVDRTRLSDATSVTQEIKLLFNADEFDVYCLLEQIQKLKEDLQNGSSAITKTVDASEDERVIVLEQELAELRRTSLLQQTALATIYNRVLKHKAKG